MLLGNMLLVYLVAYVIRYHKIYILSTIKSHVKEKEHREAFETHKKIIFEWALEIQCLQKSQRIIGLHASRGIAELLSLLLHRKKLVLAGFQLNHRWFKSEKVAEKLPEFENKDEIIKLMVRLENICEVLSYGKQRSIEKVKKPLIYLENWRSF